MQWLRNKSNSSLAVLKQVHWALQWWWFGVLFCELTSWLAVGESPSSGQSEGPTRAMKHRNVENYFDYKSCVCCYKQALQRTSSKTNHFSSTFNSSWISTEKKQALEKKVTQHKLGQVDTLTKALKCFQLSQKYGHETPCFQLDNFVRPESRPFLLACDSAILSAMMNGATFKSILQPTFQQIFH